MQTHAGVVRRECADGNDCLFIFCAIPLRHLLQAAAIPTNAREAVVKAKAAIAYCGQVRQNRLPEVDRWLGHS